MMKRRFVYAAAVLGTVVYGIGAYAQDAKNADMTPEMTEEITQRKFDGIKFVQERIDHNETGYDDAAKMLAHKYGSGNADNLPLDPQLAELVRLLISINNGCVYCDILHAKEARDLGILQAKIDILSSWRESELFTEAESSALNYAEAVSDLDQARIQDAHDRLVKHFDAAQIEALLMVTTNMDLWSRIFLAQGRKPELE